MCITYQNHTHFKSAAQDGRRYLIFSNNRKNAARSRASSGLRVSSLMSMLSSLGDVPAEIAFCFATGNTARLRALDCGLIEIGRSADFVLMDRAQHSAGKTLLESVQLGDLPGIGMTVIDGVIRSLRSRNTPPATAIPSVVPL